jgi:hypothetical protein
MNSFPLKLLKFSYIICGENIKLNVAYERYKTTVVDVKE